MWQTVKEELAAKIALIYFIVITTSWIILQLSGIKESAPNYIFGGTYGLICFLGGIYGLIAGLKWGGFSSVFGKAVIFLSLGLLTQEFGQLVFSYYNYFLGIEVPYPSIADIGFFGTIPFYILGMFYLAKAAGAGMSLRNSVKLLEASIIPAILLGLSYFMFLKDYDFTDTSFLIIFLDFGYPLGEALYISIAILTLIYSRKFLGGMMKSRILLLIIAFITQYIAETNFLFQSKEGTWLNGGYGDYLYLLAYFLMTIGLIQFYSLAKKLRN